MEVHETCSEKKDGIRFGSPISSCFDNSSCYLFLLIGNQRELYNTEPNKPNITGIFPKYYNLSNWFRCSSVINFDLVGYQQKELYFLKIHYLNIQFLYNIII